MAEVINTNVFDAEKKFVDFGGLDYFWEKAKAYINAADKVTADKVATLEGVVGDSTKGLVQKVNLIQGELDGLSGGAGSITTQITNALTGLDVEDAAVEGQYVSSVAEVDGKVVVSRANLPVYEEVGVAASAAAQALTDAKVYVDGIVNDTTTEGGTVKGLNSRIAVLEAIDHEKLASDASAAAVATVLDGAPEKFDTLKEVAQWISDSESAATAADLVTRVKALENIDHDAYVEADKTVLADAKTYADGLVKVDGVDKFDAAGSAAQALTDAKSYADGKFQVAGNYETAGTAATLVDGIANGAVKTNTEAIAVINGNAETEGSIAKAKADAIADAAAKLKAVTDTLKSAAFVEVATLEATMDSKDATNLAAAKTYAATYTDELFGSFKFAETTDIDGLFATEA